MYLNGPEELHKEVMNSLVDGREKQKFYVIQTANSEDGKFVPHLYIVFQFCFVLAAKGRFLIFPS